MTTGRKVMMPDHPAVLALVNAIGLDPFAIQRLVVTIEAGEVVIAECKFVVQEPESQ